MRFLDMFKKKCDWCTGETINVAEFHSENYKESIQVQIYEKQIQVGINNRIVAGLDIKACPMCRRKFKK